MPYISPRQLARAAGVSESSVKRWCDQGKIPQVKTAGGHRRLTLETATEFLREIGSEISPAVLGLPARKNRGTKVREDLARTFQQALIAGEEAVCRQIVFDLHLGGMRAALIFDKVIAPAFEMVGADWECGEVQIYQERRGCGLCLRVLDELKSVIPSAKASAPLAIGGAAESDHYTLPTSMVDVVLRQGGWRSQSLGSRLPFATLLQAIRDQRPALFWLSVSHIDDQERFIAEYGEFYEQAQSLVAVVVGGRALVEPIRRQLRYSGFCDNMEHLEAFAKTLRRSGFHDPQKSDSEQHVKRTTRKPLNEVERRCNEQ